MKSKILLNIIAALLCCLLLSLGIWQLHRAETKRLLLLHVTPIKTKGHYDNNHVFLLDNKFYKHQIGYEVLTPFIINNNKLILVNRGWIARDANKYPLPPVIPEAISEATIGEQIISGILYKPPEKPFLLKKTLLLNNNWPLVIQAIEIKNLQEKLKKNIYPVIIWLDKNNKNCFSCDWHPVVMPPEQHRAYAIQWFALALTLFIICIILNINNK
jgi:surfeit locus 1 family protein